MCTERIKIEKLRQRDLSFRVELLNNPEIRKFLNVSELFDLGHTTQWYAKTQTDNSRYDVTFVLKETGQAIGMGGLSNISSQNKNAELYMYISPEFQGLGYGTEALNNLCRLGFEELALKKIFLYTFSENCRANALYEKVGFVLEGILRQQTIKDGKLCNRNFYGLLNNELKL